MRGAFPKIASKERARNAIEITSIAFMIVAGFQAILGAVAISLAGNVTEAATDLFVGAAIFMALALALYYWNSRIVAATLLALIVFGWFWRISQGQRYGFLDGFAFLLGLWGGIRATQATIKFHYFAKPRETVPKQQKGKNYDVAKWEALLKYDKDIAMVADKLQPPGEKWVDEFAQAFLVLNDKKYLLDIARKIIRDAKEEADRAAAGL